jgi:hypothetical protein
MLALDQARGLELARPASDRRRVPAHSLCDIGHRYLFGYASPLVELGTGLEIQPEQQPIGTEIEDL